MPNLRLSKRNVSKSKRKITLNTKGNNNPKPQTGADSGDVKINVSDENRIIANLILGQDEFNKTAKDGINHIAKDGKFTLSDVPSLVIILIDAYKLVRDIELQEADIPTVLSIVGLELLKKQKLISKEDEGVAQDLINGSVRLALMTAPVIASQAKKAGCGCFPFC